MAAIGDIHRFPTSGHLVGYLGLHPKIRQWEPQQTINRQACANTLDQSHRLFSSD
jgi:transposase